MGKEHSSDIYRIAGYIGWNNVWWIARKRAIGGYKFGGYVQSPCLHRESTRLAQYWRCDKKSANLPNIIPPNISIEHLLYAYYVFVFQAGHPGRL